MRKRGKKIEVEEAGAQPAAESEAATEEQAGSAEAGSRAAAAGSAEAGPVVETEEGKIERLEAELARRDQELAEMKDQYLRALADLDNVRKRGRREKDEALRYGVTAIISEILPVLDNLERALKAAEAAGEKGPLMDGVAMIREQFLQLLEQRAIRPLDAAGKMFDPVYHDAVARVATTDHPEGSVIEEVQRGYAIGDTVLRPSKVVVAVAAPAASEQQTESSGESHG